MPSRFAGVDPYLEPAGEWNGFHHGLVCECVGRINAVLPEDYVACLNVRLRVLGEAGEAEQARQHLALLRRIGDAADEEDAPEPQLPASDGGGGAISRPTATLPQRVGGIDESVELSIDVFHLPTHTVGHRPTAAVELLTPSNKAGDGLAAYKARRRDLLHHDAHLVEVDLLLAGRRPVPLLAPLPAGDYFAFVTRAEWRSRCDVYGWSVRDRPPTVPVPLREGDGEVPLDVAAAYATAYDAGRLGMLIHEWHPAGSAPAGLGDADRAWAAGIAGLRRGGGG